MTDLTKRIATLTPEQRRLLDLRRKKASLEKDHGPTIPLRQGDGPWPASSDQTALWFIQQMSPGAPVYNISAGHRLMGPYDEEVFKRALHAFAQRHEIWRVSFKAINGQPFQVVADEIELDFTYYDVTDRPEEEREEAARELVRRKIMIPIDLAKPPLFRTVLVKLHEDDHAMASVLHHTITDWWSFQILGSEFPVMYQALLEGRDHNLPKVQVQFIDYAIWRNKYLESGALKKQLAYWTKKLEGAPLVVELPADRPRPPIATYRGARRFFLIPSELTERVREINTKGNASSNMTYLALTFAFLSRLTGLKDFLVGMPVTDRELKELELTYGYFLNTLLFRGDLSDDPSFLELVQRMRRIVLEASENKDLPFRSIVEALNPERDLSRMPIFQVEFIFVSASGPTLEGGAGSVASGGQGGAGSAGATGAAGGSERKPVVMGSFALNRPVSPVDLQFGFVEGREGTSLLMEFNTDIFDPETMDRFSHLVFNLARDIVNRPELPLSQMRWLTDEDERAILAMWRGPEQEFSAIAGIHGMFVAQAARTPAATALICGDTSMTFAELDAASTALARRLGREGVGPEKLVGICVDRAPRMLIALLGVLKAGGAYVPLDPSHPADRLQYIAADAGFHLLLAEAETLELWAGSPVQILRLDEPLPVPAVDSDPLPAIDPAHPAYVIYTSGSTGKPKGVAVTHHSVVNFLTGMAGEPGLQPSDRLLAVTTLSFDIAALELYLPLTVGATVVLASKETTADGRLLARALDEYGITVMQATPATWKMLLAAGWRGTPGLRMFCGGEALPFDLKETLVALDLELWNLYGPTETTIWSTRARMAADAMVAIGRAIENTTTYILDRQLRPQPAGVPGELLIGGDGLARGYWNRPDLTAERFVPDLYAATPGARVYRTGDLVVHRVSGNLEFVGRVDFQVKVRGFRIELGEIEAVLRRHESIAEAVVVARSVSEKPTAGKDDLQLVAYLVAAQGQKIDIAAARTYCAAYLPAYMVPAFFMFLDALPLTPNGKIDRKALPNPQFALAKRVYTAPRNESEKSLCEIWQDVLGLERVGVTDSFFEIGGHSLFATQMIARVQTVFGVDIPLRDLFQAPTVAAVAGMIARGGAGPVASTPVLAAIDRDAYAESGLPLSFAQERLWFVDRLEGGTAAYNLTNALQIDGLVDVDALGRALRELARRHETLRTRFSEKDGRPVQIVEPVASLALGQQDLSAFPEAEREAELQRRMDADILSPFDLTAAPLIRVVLFRMTERKHVLFLNIHHIVSDAWSTRILFTELVRLYDAFSGGETSPLPEPMLQYGDFAHWQRHWLTGEALEQQLGYWETQLAGAPHHIELATDFPRPADQTYNGNLFKFPIAGDLLAAGKALCDRLGITQYMWLLSAFAACLARHAGQDDIVLGTTAANRNRPELEGLIGFFINTLALRVNLKGDPSFEKLLERTRDMVLDAFDHQDLPFEQIVERIQPERDASRSPIFQVSFTHINIGADSGETETRVRGLTLREQETHHLSSKFDMTLLVAPHGGALVGNLEYNTDLFRAETIQAFAARFMTLLRAWTADPSLPLARVALMNSEETALLSKWSGRDVDLDRELTLAGWFAQTAAARAGQVALEYGAQTMTFGELNACANRIARHLLGLGVGRGDWVGLCLQSGPRLIAAVLGIIKAGAAYVPLDPAYPRERLTFMLEDSGMTTLITQSDLLDVLPSYQLNFLNCLVLDEAEDAVAAESDENPAADGLGALRPAYLNYTSGSTGLPKGVMVSHLNVMRLISDREYVALEPGDGVAQVSNTSFDAFTFEMWTALLLGGRLCLIDKEDYIHAESMSRELAAKRVDVLFITTALFNQFAHARPDLFSGLKFLLFGGELVNPAAVRAVLAAGPPRHLRHVYGPTESTTYSTWYPIEAVAADAVNIPIGRAIAGTRAFVTDRALNAVPAGVIGELCLGGDGLAWGYLNRPDLTAQRFVPNPFCTSTRPGERLYRTGDLVRFDPAGQIEFAGRIDHQVKLRGFRIELGEIEHHLRQFPAIEDVAVILDTATGEKRLLAYLVAKPDGETSAQAKAQMAAEVRAFLTERLPDYMVPAAFILLETLPLNANGKLDRKALPQPDTEDLTRREFLALKTPTEEVLAAIWCHTLNIARVGGGDQFFDLGGHSLLATQLISRIRDNFDVDLPLRAIFEYPELTEMAATIDVARREMRGLREPPMTPAERRVETIDGAQVAVLPASFAQERLLFLDRLGLGAAYHVPIAIRMRGKLREDLIQSCLNEVVRRHESLRTTFAEVDGVMFQRIAEPHAASFEIVDLRAESAARSASESGAGIAAERVEAEARRAFDLTAGPLLRVTLFKLPEDQYILLFNMHHIISDAWSLQILFTEFLNLYHAAALGRELALTPLSLQYGDFAAWQKSWLTGDTLDQLFDYWTGVLAGAPGHLDLPTDFPRPVNQTFEGNAKFFSFSRDILNAANVLGGRLGLTRFMWLLAGYAALLGRIARQTDIVIGTTIANRNRSAVEQMIGFFVNTLAIRVNLAGDPTMVDLLKQVRRATLDAYAHQDLPFEQLVERLQPERDPSRTPIFQVMLNLVNVGVDSGEAEVELPDLTLWTQETELHIAKFDLSLSMTEKAGELMGAFEYNTSLFAPHTIDRLEGCFQKLMAQWTADPEKPLSQIDLLDERDRELSLRTWNATQKPYPAETSIEAIFASRLAEHPDAPAVAWRQGSWSYRELDRRANRLANLLLGRGLKPGDPVGLCLEPGPDMVAAALAVLKAGGAYLPLDPAYPADRLAFMIADSGMGLLLTQESLLPQLPEFGGALVLEAIAAELSEIDENAPPLLDLGLDRRSYIIYTSGTTGQPKAVALTHRGLIRLVFQDGLLDLEPGFSVAQVSNFSFDAAAYEMWLALLRGGRLFLVDRQTYLNGERFADLLAEQRFDLLLVTTSLFNQFAATRPELFKEVGYVIFGGEKGSPEAAREVLAAAAPRGLIHAYGPSENTTFTSWKLLGPGSVGEDATWLSLGTPWSNTRVYLLDDRFQPVVPGTVGELCIGGDGLAQAYLNRPALTAQRFVPDPFAESANGGARLYRTGDLARWLPEGELVFAGRRDHQVKLRGFRIELGEIEHHLRQVDGVDDAAVLLLERGGGMLVAYVGGASELTADVLRSHLAGKLPDYMTPSAFVIMAALPLTPNHKLDRAALPEPAESDWGTGPAKAPSTPTEEVLAAIWAAILHRVQVSADDNFFNLGGHSLLATQLVSRIRDGFGVELPLQAVFEAPVLAAMAARIDRSARERRQLSAPPMIQVERPAGGAALSFAQERLWFLDRMGLGAAYHMPFVFRVEGRFDIEALRATLDGLQRRHEALRTRFVERDGKPLQIPLAPESCPAELTIYDLRDEPPAEREETLRSAIGAEAQRPFDLEQGPMMRSALFQLSDTGQVLMITMHHIVSDAWSVQLLFGEFGALYTGFAGGEARILPPLPIQYIDFAVWQRNWLTGEVLDRQLQFWTEHLAGAPAHIDLPTDFTRPPIQTHDGATFRLELAGSVSDQGKALCSDMGLTRFMWVLAAYGVLLSRYAGQKDIVVGTTIANRNRGEIEGLIGFFVNTLALRIDLGGDPSFRDLLGRVRRLTLDAYAHQDLPFEHLVEKLQPQRDTSRSPLFQVGLNMINVGVDRGGGPMTLPGVSLSMDESPTAVSKFDISLSLTEVDGILIGEFDYNTALFRQDTIARLGANFVELVARLTAEPDLPISRIAILSAEERERVLRRYNQTQAPFPGDATIHGLFEAQAARTPEAIALNWGAHVLSYEELNLRANRFAHQLIERGVGPEVRVAVCLNRTPDLLIAILGVLKAGGAYVPLDPAYPAARMAITLEDAGSTILITESAVVDLVPETAAELILIDLEAGLPQAGPETNPGIAMDATSLAYVLFTSGSTGRPKGVAIAHQSVAAMLTWAAGEYGAEQREAVLAATSVCFDLSVYELFLPLTTGGRVVLVDDALALSTVKTPVSLINTVPSAIAELLRLEAIPDSVKTINLAGEPLPGDLVRALYELPNVEKVYNLYGPSEDTTYSTFALVGRDEPAEPAIGVPLANSRVYLLDRRMEPVPFGCPGELCLAGAGLARGYLGRPDWTAERFVPDPFALDSDPQAASGRLYRTGDLARYGADGELRFIGRIDQQVKLRGFRIELGEIENRLRRHPAVREAVVAVRSPRGVKDSEALTAYLVAAAGQTPDAGELRRYLGQNLPAFMTPAYFVVLQALPLTPNGKVDRRALPQPEPGGDRPFEAPSSETEKVIADIWSELLGVEPVGVQDNFFELGGHSLMMAQVVSRLKQRLQVTVMLKTLFEYTDVRGLAQFIDVMLLLAKDGDPATHRDGHDDEEFEEDLI